MEAQIMTKVELVNGIAERVRMPRRTVKSIIEEVFVSIGDALVKGEKYTFTDFGTFEVKDRAAREGRNPQDPSKTMKIPAKKVPAFRPGKGLREKVAALEKGSKI
jgi:DNA-binding protein HU-beta